MRMMTAEELEDKRKEFYVYGVFVNQTLRYVGKGIGCRYKHCTSGKSHVEQLNWCRDNNYLIEVRLLKENLTNAQSLVYEARLIESYGATLYNVKGMTKEYYQADATKLYSQGRLVDAYKHSSAEVMKEVLVYDRGYWGFSYTWDQATVDSINHQLRNQTPYDQCPKLDLCLV